MLNDNPVFDALICEIEKSLFNKQRTNKTNPTELNERKREVQYYRELEKTHDDIYGF